MRGGERRLVTVLFADLAGFTAISERLDPEDVHAFLSPLMDELAGVVDAHGGTVLNWMGDGFMSVFGVPITHSDDAERAVRAASACLDVIRRRASASGWAGPADLHAGIHTGEVLVVRVRGGIDLVGDTVNTAARLVDVAPPGCVLVGAATRELTDHIAEYDPWEPIQLRGKAEPMPAFQVRSVTERRGERPRAADETDFVGRTAELDWLAGRLEQVRGTPTSDVVGVVGVPGVGKSRLIDHFTRASGAGAVLGRCQAYGERAPWHALADALRSALELPPSIEPDEVHNAIADTVARLFAGTPERERRALIESLATVFGLGGAPVPPGIRQLNLDAAIAVRRVLSSVANARPVVVVIEDVQWADPQVLAFLAWVSEEPWPDPVLFVCIGRPDALEHELLKLEEDRVLRVHALSYEECDAMLARLIPQEVSGPMREELLKRSGGNPLFLEETVHLLHERGSLDPAVLDPVPGGPSPAIPETVQLVIAERIDGLPDDERRALRDAAVAGEVFWDRLLRALGWGEEIHDLLERLGARDFIRDLGEDPTIEGARAFEFKHAVIREVAYGTLPRGDRAAKHLAIAGWLRASASTAAEPVDLLASHYSRAVALNPDLPAHTVRQAVQYLKRAGDGAATQLAWREAEGQYAHALSIGEALEQSPLHGDGELVAEARLAHAEVLGALLRYEEARTEGAAMLELATAADRPDWHVRALLVVARGEAGVPNEAAARELLSRAMAIARENRDPRAEAIGLFETAFTWRYEDLSRMEEWLRRAADAFAALGEVAWEVRCVEDLAGRLAEAEAHAQRMREFGERARFRRTVALSLLVGARVASRSGDTDLATEAIDRADALFGELRAELERVEVNLARAEIALDRGAFDEAEASARRYIEPLRAYGPRWRPYGLTLLGLARLGAEDLPGARAAFEDASRHGQDAGNRWATTRAAVALAEIDALEGRRPADIPMDLPTPLERALAAEARGLRGDPGAWDAADREWSDLGETVWRDRARRLAENGRSAT
ncbi:MAG: AAA family ATPase [Actinobacteria bacterium]|nr:AAA family ATPase [Actinomycetota bacterium]